MTNTLPKFLSGLPYIFQRREGARTVLYYSGCMFCSPADYDVDEASPASNPATLRCVNKDCRANGVPVQKFTADLWDSTLEGGFTSFGIRYLENQFTREERKGRIRIIGLPDFVKIAELVPDFENVKRLRQKQQKEKEATQ